MSHIQKSNLLILKQFETSILGTPPKKKSKGFSCMKKHVPWELMNDRELKSKEFYDEYPNNSISTSKYNAFNFLPKNLFYQFSKFANVYFVVNKYKTFFNIFCII